MKTQNTKLHRNRASRRGGFTLIEILVVLGIIIAIAGSLGVPMYQRAEQQKLIAGATRAIANAKSALAMFTQQSDYTGTIPITEGTGIPLTGTMAGATNTVISNATTLQVALLTAKCLEAPIAPTLGSSSTPTGATTAPVLWNQATGTFSTTGDVTPTQDYSATGRLECKLATPATAPSAAAGGNFRLDATNNVSSNTHVVYWVFTNVPSEVAREFARAVYKGTVSASGALQDVGPVVYPAADAQGNTTVYAYVGAY
jgi:prepilin-type N-terminal cleavage/methylation domain-containing protein